MEGEIHANGNIDAKNSYVDELDVARKHGYDFRVIPGTFNYSTGYYQYQANLPTYQIDDASGTVKPFLPGTSSFVTSRNELDQNSLFSPDKTAGVDSLGLLSGALGMSKDSALLYLNALNQDVPSVINAYASMNETSISNPYTGDSRQIEITGQDSDNTPAYYVLPAEKSFTEMPARFTRGDLERISVFVPSLTEVRQGDLVVNFNVDGEPVIGVVVATLWKNDDMDEDQIKAVADSMSTSQFLENIIVVGVRQGLNQVTIGRWGNPSGSFGGFTQTPEAFHVRRLLSLPASQTMVMKDAEGWDLFDEIDEKLRNSYPLENRVPRGYASIIAKDEDGNTIVSESSTTADPVIVDELVKGRTSKSEGKEGHYYYRELPSTSLRNRVTQSLFKTDYPDAEEDKNAQMIIESITGWRNSGLRLNQYRLGYHMGIDIIEIVKDRGTMPEERFPILAPEDGKFFIWRSDSADISKLLNIDVDGDNAVQDTDDISLSSYSVDDYGFIGVLVTNPDDVKLGRVYLFCHLGDNSNGNIGIGNERIYTVDPPYDKIAYQSDYTNGTLFESDVYPNSYSIAIDVTAGQAIAYVGDKGAPKHIHLEVYEYFAEATDDNSKWLRIDPLSVFDSSLFTITNEGLETESYGWWSTLYGNRDDYVSTFEKLYTNANFQSKDSLSIPKALGINLYSALLWKEFGESFEKWKWAPSSIYYYDLIDAEDSVKPREVFLPDNWDMDRIP